MSRKITITGVAISITFIVTLLVAYAQPLNTLLDRQDEKNLSSAKAASAEPQAANGNDVESKNSRRLALQPEALKLSRLIGAKRFKSRTAPALIVQGMLKTDGDSQHVTIIRRPTADGEQVEVTLGGRRTSLVWTRNSGPRSVGGETPGRAERILLERLTYDSVDQFLLAQLRGASYSVVIRNLRPDDAGDDYAGALWDVVRVDDPEPDEQKRPLSRWRLYYINRATGLIDKVISEIYGERVEAQLAEWTERNGEKFPASINWSGGGQSLMTLNVINVSLAAN